MKSSSFHLLALLFIPTLSTAIVVRPLSKILPKLDAALPSANTIKEAIKEVLAPLDLSNTTPRTGVDIPNSIFTNRLQSSFARAPNYGQTFFVVDNPTIPNANCYDYMLNTPLEQQSLAEEIAPTMKDPNNPCALVRGPKIPNPESFDPESDEDLGVMKIADGWEASRGIIICETTAGSPLVMHVDEAAYRLKTMPGFCAGDNKRGLCSNFIVYAQASIGYCRVPSQPIGAGHSCNLLGKWATEASVNCSWKGYSGGRVRITKPAPPGGHVIIYHSGRGN